jgi:hypothetical protein
MKSCDGILDDAEHAMVAAIWGRAILPQHARAGRSARKQPRRRDVEEWIPARAQLHETIIEDLLRESGKSKIALYFSREVIPAD